MFDPTIFDNLKVIFEGALYDLDHDRRLQVVGREDLVDLASMSRTFRMRVRMPDRAIQAVVLLQSGLLDFAGELRHVRLAEQSPGCELELQVELPAAKAVLANDYEQYLAEVWGEVAHFRHEVTTPLLRESGEDAQDGQYRITLRFRAKIDEDHIHDVESLLQHLVATMEFLDETE